MADFQTLINDHTAAIEKAIYREEGVYFSVGQTSSRKSIILELSFSGYFGKTIKLLTKRNSVENLTLIESLVKEGNTLIDSLRSKKFHEEIASYGPAEEKDEETVVAEFNGIILTQTITPNRNIFTVTSEEDSVEFSNFTTAFDVFSSLMRKEVKKNLK